MKLPFFSYRSESFPPSSSSLFRHVPVGGLLSVASVFAPLLVPQLPAIAQVGVSPLVMESQATQGRSQGVITLNNDTDEAVRVRIFAEPFTYGTEGFTTLAEAPEDLSDYLQFSPREATIPPGEEQRVRLLTLFPPDLAPGEYRAVVFAEELNETLDFNNNVAVRVRIGSTIYVQNGELAGELSALSAQAIPDRSQIDMRLRNDGLATVRVTTDWQLYEASQEVASGTVSLHTVIAEGERRLSVALPEALPAGTYTIKGHFSWTTLGQENTQPFELPVVVL